MYFWLFVIIFLTILEVMTVNLVSIWFIISAIISLMISFVFDNFVIEMTVFVISGILLLITTKPIFSRLLKTNNEKLNCDRIIGMTAIVTEDIKDNAVGEVKVDGKKWSAIAENDFIKGEKVKVASIDGVKLKVEKI